ncbi:MAG: SpoIIE family protein phosphatase [Pirellulales bacterium]|nr:SpoIIE family protein phosphatase [Pirellulales bacterium]
MATLTILQGGDVGRQFKLGDSESVIGRNPECDVVLDAAAVSRRHAIVSREREQYFIRDNDSRNGTIVNGQQIHDRAALRDGDQVLICDVLLEFRNPAAAGLLSGGAFEGSSLLRTLVDTVGDDGDLEGSSVMATLDVTKDRRAGWQVSARPEQQLQAMVEISNNLSNTLSVKDLLPKVLDSLFKIFVQADRGFILMQPTPGAPLAPVATKARRGEDEGMRWSKTIVQRAITEKKAILSADAASDARFNMAQSIADFHIRSLICAPMLDAGGDPIGVIQIDTSDQRSRFTDLDLQVLAGVAGQAANALDNARMHEQMLRQQALQRDLEVAREMQQALLPRSAPDVRGYHFFQHYQAAYEVGGDYYDYVLLPEDRFATVVGDVAGKGVSAAILMAKLSSDVRFWLAREPDPARAMAQINATFLRHGWDDRFVTMVVAVVDPQACLLTLVNAGHMPPILRSADGKVQEVGGDEAGLPLGVAEDYQYEAFRREFLAGDLLTIFTDGFSEAMNSRRELFGIDRLLALCGDKTAQPRDLGSCILQSVRKFAGDYPQSDDMCLVCFGRD